MAIMKKFRSTQFFHALKLIKQNPKNLLLMFVFDALFCVLLYLLNVLLGRFSAALGMAESGYFFLAIVNMIIVILLYSFFKWRILHLMLRCTQKSSAIKIPFIRFCLLNIIIYLVFSLAVFILSLIVMSVIKEDSQYLILGIVAVIFGVFIYAFLNSAHILFARRLKIRDSLKEAYALLSTATPYKPLFSSFIILVILFIILSLISVLVSYIIFKISPIYSAINNYSIIIAVIYFVFVYLLVLFNRIYYLLLVASNSHKI